MPAYFNDGPDKEPDKNDLYYDALELLDEGKPGAQEALELLNRALEMDEDCVQTYIGFICVYGALEKKDEREKMTKIAYSKTLKKFPEWPETMEWADLDNRAYMRAIQFMAELYWDYGQNEEAAELFRLLLKLNPGDNQGVRYEIAALYAGLSGDDVNRMFDEGNAKQNWDELKDLVEEQNKKYKFWEPLVE